MAGVDNRIVTMKFDNREFETNARTSMSTLQKLKESMNFGSIVGGTIRGLDTISSALSKLGLKTPFAPLISTANKGLGLVGSTLDRLGLKNPFASSIQSASDLQKAAQTAGGPAGMGVLEGGVTAVSNKFLILSTVAITALSNITNKAINASTAWAKSFTFAPINDGLKEYELNLKSIQTIQANTDRPLPEITGALDELNKYADLTIYNFGEMARNIGTFTAAGVDLETSVSAIKGIANMAALSGSNSQQASTAMYQLSQALAAGKVGLMDWNSVVNAGMGGKKLQNALAQTAIAMGDIDAAQVKGVKSGEQLTIMGNSFRESIMAKPGEEGWLSAKVLENTLASLDGRYSVAALQQEKLADGTLKYKNRAEAVAAVEKARNEAAKEGVVYTEEQFKALQKLSTSAFESATKVKTLGEVFDIAKETIGSGWAASFQNIFGNLKEAKKLFTGMSEGLNSILDANAIARNNMLAAWKKGGGRDTVIEGLKNAWEGVWSIVQAVGKGFRDIFPRKTADDLISMSESFRDFTKSLIPGEKTLENISSIASGVFSIFGIGKTIVLGLFSGLKTMFGAIGDGGGDFLSLAARVGDAVTNFHLFLQESGLVKAFFEGLGAVLSVPLSLLKNIAGALSNLFGGFDTGALDGFSEAAGKASTRLSSLQIVGKKLRDSFSGLAGFFKNVGEGIGQAFSGIGTAIANAITAENFGQALDVINTALLGGIVVLLRKFFSGGINIDLGGGFLSTIKETLGETTSSLQTMQNSLKANILLKLAGAIAVMAGALLLLSQIDPGALTRALGAMTAGFGVLIGALVVLMKYTGPMSIVQIYVVTSAMTKMAASILLLSLALKTLASIHFGDMLRGLVGLAATMSILSKAMVPIAAGSKGMVRAAWSITILGVALNILALALKLFATMSWGEMIKGLVGVTATLAIMTAVFKRMPPLQAEAIGIIALAVAMNILGLALKLFATMSWEEMAKGLATLAGALAIIAVTIRMMPKTMMLQATALVAVAGAMVILSGAIKVMSKMGWEEIAKGLLVLGGAMLILAVGLQAIGVTGTVGAVGLVAAAAALAVITPLLVTLGALSWEAILKGLVGFAGVLTLMGVAGFLLAPVIPIILGLGAAMLLFGAGLSMAGAGALSAAMAFGIVVAAGTAGAQVLVTMLSAIIDSIPQAMAAFGQGVVAFATAIGDGAPKIASAFGKILSNLIDAVIKNTPKLAKMFLTMLNTALRVIVTAIPRIVEAGLRLIVSFLEAVDRHIPRIVDLASSIIVKFIDGIARNLGKIIQSGVNLIIKFIEGVAAAIRNNGERVGRAGADLGLALVEGIAGAIRGGAGLIKDAAMAAAKDAWQAAKDFFRIRSPSRLMYDTVGKPIMQGWAGGMRSEAPAVTNEIRSVGKTALLELKRSMSDLDRAFEIDPNLNPTITPVLDLTALTREANKVGDILSVSPITPAVSYQTAADISALTRESEEARAGGENERGDQYNELNLHLHSPRPIDSVETYRTGKTLISLAKEALN